MSNIENHNFQPKSSKFENYGFVISLQVRHQTGVPYHYGKTEKNAAIDRSRGVRFQSAQELYLTPSRRKVLEVWKSRIFRISPTFLGEIHMIITSELRCPGTGFWNRSYFLCFWKNIFSGGWIERVPKIMKNTKTPRKSTFQNEIWFQLKFYKNRLRNKKVRPKYEKVGKKVLFFPLFHILV